IITPDDLSFGEWRQTEATDHYLQGRMDEIFLARAYLAVDQVRAVLEAGRTEPYISDSFDGDEIDPVRWGTVDDVVLANGRVELAAGLEGFGEIHTHVETPINFAGGEVVFAPGMAPVVEPGDLLDAGVFGLGGGHVLFARLAVYDPDQELQFFAGDGRVAAVPYDPVAHKYVRVSYIDGVARMEASPDGWSWTVIASQTIALDLSNAAFSAYALAFLSPFTIDDITLRAPAMMPGDAPTGPEWDGTPWVEWPQGVFLLSTPNRDSDAAGVVRREVEAYDQLQVYVDDKVTDRFIATVGDRYTDVVSGLLGAVSKNITASELTLPYSMEWEPGTSKLTIINELLAAINY